MLGSTPLGAAPLAGSVGGSAATHTLVAAAGAFRLVGDGGSSFSDSVVFLGLGVGGFALTGSDAHLFKPTYAMTLQPGAFALGGAVGALVRGYTLQAGVGAFSLAIAATARFSRVARVGAGAFRLDASPATFLKGFSIQLGVGSFRLDASVSCRATRSLIAEPRALTLTGRPAALRARRVLLARLKVMLLDGGFPTLSLGFTMQGLPGSFALSSPAARLKATRLLPVQPATYRLVADDATAAAHRGASLRSGTFSLLGDARLARGRVAAVPGAKLTLVGVDAEMRIVRHLTIAAGSFALKGSRADASRSRVLRAAGGVILLRAGSLSGRVGRPNFRLDAGVFNLGAPATTFLRPRQTLICAPGTFTLHGDAAHSAHGSDLAGISEGPRWEMQSTVAVVCNGVVQKAASV